MTKTFSARRYENGAIVQVTYSEISICPKCKRSMAPFPQYGFVNKKSDQNYYFSVLDFCSGCNSGIVSEYNVRRKIKPNGNGVFDDQFTEESFNYSAPSLFTEKGFEDGIAKLSPQFVKIYNQALQAESQMLDEIAGLGYRKALEFLIKDFAINKNPDNEDKIQNMPLGQCIKSYVIDPSIKILTDRAAWLGNDEAHYMRKHTNRDVKDLKKFISATVHFISMILIVDDAETMTPK